MLLRRQALRHDTSANRPKKHKRPDRHALARTLVSITDIPKDPRDAGEDIGSEIPDLSRALLLRRNIVSDRLDATADPALVQEADDFQHAHAHAPVVVPRRRRHQAWVFVRLLDERGDDGGDNGHLAVCPAGVVVL